MKNLRAMVLLALMLILTSCCANGVIARNKANPSKSFIDGVLQEHRNKEYGIHTKIIVGDWVEHNIPIELIE